MPLLGSDTGNGYTDEEMKLQNESRKILGSRSSRSRRRVRVPVMVGHAVEVRAQFEREPSVARALEVMGAHDGVELDDVPTPLEWAGKDPVAVGRVRQDLSDPKALNLFIVGDNLLKGAALNTVQIAELLHERGLLGTRGGLATRRRVRPSGPIPARDPALWAGVPLPSQREQADVVGLLPAGEGRVRHRVG